MKDNRGTPIEVGCQVAYNYSGQIAVGKVLSATPKKITIELGINMNTDGVVKRPGKISIVKNRQNVLVLKE
jgi:hypothetical protein